MKNPLMALLLGGALLGFCGLSICLLHVLPASQAPHAAPGLLLDRAIQITEFCASFVPLLDGIAGLHESDRSVPRAVALMRLQYLSFTVPTRVVDFVTRSIETLYATPAARVDFWDGCHAAWS
jgi:hypothetical protein